MKKKVRDAFDSWLSELDIFVFEGTSPRDRWFSCYRWEGIDFRCEDMSFQDFAWFIVEVFERYKHKLEATNRSFQFYVWFDTFNIAMSAIDSLSPKDLPFGGRIQVSESLEGVFAQLQELEFYGILSSKNPLEEPPESYDDSREHITMVYRKVHIYG